jgi:DNA-binding transcriptional MerR regulator
MARRTSTRNSTRGEVVLMSRSVLRSIAGISERELASWEREDLIVPVRVDRVRGRLEALYDREALRRVRVIRTLAEDLEVNIPGIGVILHLLDQIER